MSKYVSSHKETPFTEIYLKYSSTEDAAALQIQLSDPHENLGKLRKEYEISDQEIDLRSDIEKLHKARNA